MVMEPGTEEGKGAALPARAHTSWRSRRSYDVHAVEEKWRAAWERQGLHRPNLDASPRPFYNLMMFPYPSAEGLHVGNCFAFIGADIFGRYMRLRGNDVFEPIGFDAFGIHSENYALKVGKHPGVLVPENIARFKTQLARLGAQFDWTRTVDTTDPAYYRWTQWLFVQLMKAGLAEQRRAPVNWCPSCKTVLADEQVIDGNCERCKSVVVERDLLQWFFTITRYQETLLRNLDWIDWSEDVKAAQRRWIGRSDGAEVMWRVEGAPGSSTGATAARGGAGSSAELTLTTFTTRIDTLMGVTFLVISPEHPLTREITTPEHADAVLAYAEGAKRKSRFERAELGKGKSGVPTGAHALHPVTGARIPIWTADYVLMGYGTGVVQGVPAHDVRDHEFATKFALPIAQVVRPPSAVPRDTAYEGEGTLANSGEFDGLSTEDARTRITAWLEAGGMGRAKTQYRLHDWCVSRQRYWGPPIPVIHCAKCGAMPVPEESLPVLLPMTNDYIPDDSGLSPLAKIASFVETTCPKCGGPARRDTDVLDNFLDSAWYYFRYPSTEFNDTPWDSARTSTWLPVDMYIGGREHSVLHLLYTRFLCLALHDLGHVPFAEPFERFRAHGLIVKDGSKMSKSRGNVVNPDEYLTNSGSDAFRLYLMFLGPFIEGGDFRDEGMVGVERFLDRVHNLAHARDARLSREADSKLHWAIKKVTDDIESLKYNTGIAAMMETLNLFEKEAPIPTAALARFAQILAPLAPHLAEEVWERCGMPGSIFRSAWPEYDPALVAGDSVEIVFQVNGKVRGKASLPIGASEQAVKEAALADPGVRAHTEGKSIARVLVVPGRLVNIVAK
jgi:leucyl-tRNA synthetase